jgi:hypothetical protein
MANQSGKSEKPLTIESVEAGITVFFCGPNRECDHDMSLQEDLYDEGRVCGSTAKCSKCGETAFNISMWDGY